MKFAGLIARLLWLVFGLHCVFGSKGDANFKVRIREKGTRFIEKIKINEQENTVRFAVPKHNDIDKSEVLLEFNLNLTITRLSDKRVCYIKPMDEGLRSPRKLKSDLNYVSHAKPGIKKAGSFLSSTQWRTDGKVEPKDLPPVVVRFCAGFPVYQLKKISEDNEEVEPEEGSRNDSTVTHKRGLQKRQSDGVPMCEKNPQPPPCRLVDWKYYCKLHSESTCVYWAQCNIKNIIGRRRQSSLKGCEFKHSYSSVICCEFRCPSK